MLNESVTSDMHIKMHDFLKVLKGSYYAQKTEYIRIPSEAAPEFHPLLVMKSVSQKYALFNNNYNIY